MAVRSVISIASLVYPANELLAERVRLIIGLVAGFELAQPDLGQRHMIHVGGVPFDSSMLEMTLATASDVGMEHGRLTIQKRFVVSVAGDALRRFRPLDGRMARGAVVFQKSVRGGQVTGTGLTLPGHGLRKPVIAGQDVGAHNESNNKEGCDQADPTGLCHENHLKPK